MRDEDLKNLPQSIEAWKIKEMLEALGITDWTNVAEMHVYPREVQVTVYATDADGRKYFAETPTQIEVTDLTESEPSYVAERPDRKPAIHEISIPVVGPWEKPAEEVDPDPKDLSLEDREQMQADIVQSSLPKASRCWSHLTGADSRVQCEFDVHHRSEHAATVNGVLHKW